MHTLAGSAITTCASLFIASGLAVAAQGHPEPIFGTIDGIHAGEYSIKGDHGKNINVRITKDTNVVCTTGKGSDFSSSREAVKEIPASAPDSPVAKGQAAGSPGKGLEFISKSREGCTFQTGDYVKVVASDTGAAQTIQKLARDKADSQ